MLGASRGRKAAGSAFKSAKPEYIPHLWGTPAATRGSKADLFEVGSTWEASRATSLAEEYLLPAPNLRLSETMG
jgi:hypothetical protein